MVRCLSPGPFIITCGQSSTDRALAGAEYEKKGYVVDARLSHFAIGWDMARKIGSSL
jgi:hypothetical protein